jgi:alanine-glyoxylate transaminase/serine-glyoxylate transaminase/serine-pyruvate transaminase
VAGRVFRIGHLGDLNELMVLTALSGVELTLRDQNVPFTVGSGVAAAIEHFHRTQPAQLAKAA